MKLSLRYDLPDINLIFINLNIRSLMVSSISIKQMINLKFHKIRQHYILIIWYLIVIGIGILLSRWQDSFWLAMVLELMSSSLQCQMSVNISCGRGEIHRVSVPEASCSPSLGVSRFPILICSLSENVFKGRLIWWRVGSRWRKLWWTLYISACFWWHQVCFVCWGGTGTACSLVRSAGCASCSALGCFVTCFGTYRAFCL